MKKTLKNNYNIDIKEYKKYKEGIILYLNSEYYYFTKTSLNEEQLLNIFNTLKNYKIKFHSFIFNKYNKLNTNNYVLLKINTLISKITIEDTRTINKINLNAYINKYIYMDEIWESKIDYLEYQLNELSDNKLINNSFDYFVGIAEILIKFYKNNYQKDNIVLSLSHRSLNSLNTIDFYNPLEISCDHYLKDIASYIKLTNNYDLLLKIIDKLNTNDKIYLFIRMTFPHKYFYEIERILIDKEKENKITKILNNIDKYENYLRYMEKIFGIKIFSWIKKE